MKTTLLLITLLTGCASTEYNYVKVGAGLKFDEANLEFDDGSTNSPISARIEVGREGDNYSYGISHHSQYFVGKPFNNKMEYAKTELFVDYIYKF